MSKDDLKTLNMNQEDKDYEEFKQNLELLEFHQRKVEWLQKKTRQYIYAMEALRVQNRKTDSDRYYRELEHKQNQI